ncbi:fragile X mental retardation syndrome-related protein 1 [Clonorchis sinensis]|uniref:Fragile X mental retardation syndrome-related protein 1 n=1 Tax=Clonorchis sinensis TaxID=79923 RepID=G7Y941_CLOSI|nr:fragile X mental retardation syndrome-related protein 1 [Clonorchis sinensis]
MLFRHWYNRLKVECQLVSPEAYFDRVPDVGGAQLHRLCLMPPEVPNVAFSKWIGPNLLRGIPSELAKHHRCSIAHCSFQRSTIKDVPISITLMCLKKGIRAQRTVKLQAQAAKCDYGAQLEDQLQDRPIADIQLSELQQKLLLCPHQNFQTVRKICEQYEDVKHIVALIRLFKNLRNVSLVDEIILDIHSLTGKRSVLSAGKRDTFNLFTSVNENELKQSILKCSEATGGVQIPKVKLEATGDPIFLKKRIIPFGLREPVRQALNSMCEKGILTRVESPNWATPIVTTLKADGIAPRIWKLPVTANTRLLQPREHRFPAFHCRCESVPLHRKSPAFLLKSRSLRIILDGAKAADVKFVKGSASLPATGITLSSTGKRMVTIFDLDDLSSHRKHIDKVEFNIRCQSVNGTPAVSNTDESFVDDLMVSEQNASSEEHTNNEQPEVSNPIPERLQSRPPLNYKHPHAHSRRSFTSAARQCSASARVFFNVFKTRKIDTLSLLTGSLSSICLPVGNDTVFFRSADRESTAVHDIEELFEAYFYCSRIFGVSPISPQTGTGNTDSPITEETTAGYSASHCGVFATGEDYSSPRTEHSLSVIAVEAVPLIRRIAGTHELLAVAVRNVATSRTAVTNQVARSEIPEYVLQAAAAAAPTYRVRPTYQVELQNSAPMDFELDTGVTVDTSDAACGKEVYVKLQPSDNEWVRGCVKSTNRNLIDMLLEDGRIIRRHLDHIRTRKHGPDAEQTLEPTVQVDSGLKQEILETTTDASRCLRRSARESRPLVTAYLVFADERFYRDSPSTGIIAFRRQLAGVHPKTSTPSGVKAELPALSPVPSNVVFLAWTPRNSMKHASYGFQTQTKLSAEGDATITEPVHRATAKVIVDPLFNFFGEMGAYRQVYTNDIRLTAAEGSNRSTIDVFVANGGTTNATGDLQDQQKFEEFKEASKLSVFADGKQYGKHRLSSICTTGFRLIDGQPKASWAPAEPFWNAKRHRVDCGSCGRRIRQDLHHSGYVQLPPKVSAAVSKFLTTTAIAVERQLLSKSNQDFRKEKRRVPAKRLLEEVMWVVRNRSYEESQGIIGGLNSLNEFQVHLLDLSNNNHVSEVTLPPSAMRLPPELASFPFDPVQGQEVDVLIPCAVPTESTDGDDSALVSRLSAWWPGRVKKVGGGFVIVELVSTFTTDPVPTKHSATKVEVLNGRISIPLPLSIEKTDIVEKHQLRPRSHQSNFTASSFHMHAIDIPDSLVNYCREPANYQHFARRCGLPVLVCMAPEALQPETPVKGQDDETYELKARLLVISPDVSTVKRAAVIDNTFIDMLRQKVLILQQTEELSRKLEASRVSQIAAPFIEEVYVPEHLIPYAIGFQGSNIRRASNIDGVFSIKLNRSTWTFQISGKSKEAVLQARALLDYTTEVIPVPRTYVGPIVGSGQRHIQHIVDCVGLSGLKICHMPEEEMQNFVAFHLTGTSQAIRDARMFLEFHVASLQDLDRLRGVKNPPTLPPKKDAEPENHCSAEEAEGNLVTSNEDVENLCLVIGVFRTLVRPGENIEPVVLKYAECSLRQVIHDRSGDVTSATGIRQKGGRSSQRNRRRPPPSSHQGALSNGDPIPQTDTHEDVRTNELASNENLEEAGRQTSKPRQRRPQHVQAKNNSALSKHGALVRLLDLSASNSITAKVTTPDLFGCKSSVLIPRPSNQKIKLDLSKSATAALKPEICSTFRPTPQQITSVKLSRTGGFHSIYGYNCSDWRSDCPFWKNRHNTHCLRDSVTKKSVSNSCLYRPQNKNKTRSHPNASCISQPSMSLIEGRRDRLSFKDSVCNVKLPPPFLCDCVAWLLYAEDRGRLLVFDRLCPRSTAQVSRGNQLHIRLHEPLMVELESGKYVDSHTEHLQESAYGTPKATCPLPGRNGLLAFAVIPRDSSILKSTRNEDHSTRPTSDQPKTNHVGSDNRGERLVNGTAPRGSFSKQNHHGDLHQPVLSSLFASHSLVCWVAISLPQDLCIRHRRLVKSEKQSLVPLMCRSFHFPIGQIDLFLHGHLCTNRVHIKCDGVNVKKRQDISATIVSYSFERRLCISSASVTWLNLILCRIASDYRDVAVDQYVISHHIIVDTVLNKLKGRRNVE